MSLNLLEGTRLYMIGGMENFNNGNVWRDEVKKELEPIGIKCFDPYVKPFINEIKEDKDARILLNDWMKDGEFDRVANRMKAVRSDDLRLVDLSDFFIAYIHPKIASWGSAEEIFWANRLKKPLFIVVEGGKKNTPLWLMGMLPHHYFYDTMQDAVEMVKQIDNGTKAIDSKRWRLLKKEIR